MHVKAVLNTGQRAVTPASLRIPGDLLTQNVPRIRIGQRPLHDAIKAEISRFTQRKDHQLMQDRLRAALRPDAAGENKTLASFIEDATQTLCFLGLDSTRAHELCHWILGRLREDKLLAEIERDVHRKLKSIVVDPASGSGLIEAIDAKLEGRAECIFSQIRPYLQQHAGQRILDFGAGDGGVTRLISEQVSKNTVGIDVRAYGKHGVDIQAYDGRTIPFADHSFDCIVSTNVLHHAEDNQQCLDEFRRVLRQNGSAVIIETVPLGESEEEARKNWELTFLNDYFYNRLLHDADVPVPGTFETFQGWSRRLEKVGFRVKATEDFGVDLPIIKDRHVLLHAEKL